MTLSASVKAIAGAAFAAGIACVACCAASRAAGANSQRDSGSSSNTAYNPCPKDGPCRILALGDSITAGAGSTMNGSYRAPLFRKARQNGQSIDFVGSVRGGPSSIDGASFPRAHEGHGGYTIDGGGGRPGISPLVVGAVTQYQPNIVTLMIGTNDVDLHVDLASAPARLGALIDAIVSTDPKVLVVLAQITPTGSDAEDAVVAAYNAAMPELVAARVAAGKHVALVDMHSAFKKNPRFASEYMVDNLHPNDAGYAVMADVWYAAIGRFFH